MTNTTISDDLCLDGCILHNHIVRTSIYKIYPAGPFTKQANTVPADNVKYNTELFYSTSIRQINVLIKRVLTTPWPNKLLKQFHTNIYNYKLSSQFWATCGTQTLTLLIRLLITRNSFGQSWINQTCTLNIDEFIFQRQTSVNWAIYLNNTDRSNLPHYYLR